MKKAFGLRLKRLSETDGIAAVEFAIILSVFLMMLLGIIEFGYDWFLKHALTNASRDGARYGVIYRADGSGNRIWPYNLPNGNFPKISTMVKNELSSSLPDAVSTTVTVDCSNTGWTASPNPGDPITVKVTATKNWSALGALIPSLSNKTISAQTTMNLE